MELFMCSHSPEGNIVSHLALNCYDFQLKTWHPVYYKDITATKSGWTLHNFNKIIIRQSGFKYVLLSWPFLENTYNIYTYIVSCIIHILLSNNMKRRTITTTCLPIISVNILLAIVYSNIRYTRPRHEVMEVTTVRTENQIIHTSANSCGRISTRRLRLCMCGFP